MKSPKRALIDAAELLAIAGVTNADLVCVSVFPGLVMIQLRPASLLRVYRQFGVSPRLVKASVSRDGNFHVKFKARGAEWSCCVLRDSPEGREWQSSIEARTAAALTDRPKLLTLERKEEPCEL